LLSFDAYPGEWCPREFAYIHTDSIGENQSPIDTTSSYSAKFRVRDTEAACSKSQWSFQVMKCELSRYDEWYLAGPEK